MEIISFFVLSRAEILDSSVGIMIRLRVRLSRFRVPGGKGIFFLSKTSKRLCGPPIQWELDFFTGDKAARRDVDHTRRSSAEVKNEWSAPRLHQYAFITQTEKILHFLRGSYDTHRYTTWEKWRIFSFNAGYILQRVPNH
jgi:hypothetical protein